MTNARDDTPRANDRGAARGGRRPGGPAAAHGGEASDGGETGQGGTDALVDPTAGASSGLPALPWREERRHPRRGAHPVLDRAAIVDAALRIVDAEGVDGLSIRRLAADLGVTPMAVYWHVRDKAELLDLVGERVLEGIVVPPRAGDWQHELREVHTAMLDALQAHPNAVDLMAGRARYGAAGIALFERILEVLDEAGFEPRDAFDAYQSLYMFQLGFAVMAGRSPDFREAQRQGVAYLRSLDPARFPAIARVAPAIGGRSPSEQYGIGLETVIDGLTARLAAARRPDG